MRLERPRATDPPISQMMAVTATLKQPTEGSEGIADQPRRTPLHAKPWYMHTLSELSNQRLLADTPTWERPTSRRRSEKQSTLRALRRLEPANAKKAP